MEKRPNQSLLIAGALLILLGFMLGAVIPVFINPRMALSGHQQGIIAGILLMLFGLSWSYTVFVGHRARLTERFLIGGAYTIWAGTLLGAIFGTSRAMPIAGAGFKGAPWQEICVSIILLFGSISAILGTGLLLSGFVRKAKTKAKNSEP